MRRRIAIIMLTGMASLGLVDTAEAGYDLRPCVAKQEIRILHKGMDKQKAQFILDTKGTRVGDNGYPNEIRDYRPCNKDRMYFTIKYYYGKIQWWQMF